MRILSVILLVAITASVYAGIPEGLAAIKKSEFKKAFQEFNEAASKGDMAAKYFTGFLYMKGRGVQKDEKKGIKLILESANSGYPLAQTMMGVFYKKGIGVKKDLKKSFSWYLRAANNKDTNAQGFLAFGYYYGIGTPINKKHALLWALTARKNGNKLAEELISKLKITLSVKDKEWVDIQIRLHPK